MVIYLCQVSVTYLLLVMAPGGVIGCTSDGSHWIYKDCNSLIAMWMVHTVATMQTASMSRNVFIKTIKDVKKTEDYQEAEQQSYLLKDVSDQPKSLSESIQMKRDVIR